MLSNETFILFFKEEMLGKILTMKQVKIKWTYWCFSFPKPQNIINLFFEQYWYLGKGVIFRLLNFHSFHFKSLSTFLDVFLMFWLFSLGLIQYRFLHKKKHLFLDKTMTKNICGSRFFEGEDTNFFSIRGGY